MEICIFFVVFLLTDSQLTMADIVCDPSECNREGLCTLVNDRPSCRCIGSTYFTGTKCSELIDNCQKNPCRNGGTCTNAVGQYYCDPCAVGFGGQQCSVAASNVPTKWHLLFNRIGTYGEPHIFMATVESLGQLPFSYELSSETVSIEALETQPTGAGTASHWQSSSNLAAVALSLNLQHASRLPYQHGHYHISRGHFWSAGQHNISLLVYDTKSVSQMFVMAAHTLEILPPADVHCVPRVTFPHCSNPNKPLFVDIARYNNFEPIVQKRCYMDSKVSYRWVVTNIVDTVQLHYYEEVDSILLKVPPYKLWFNYHDSVMQSYQIRLEVSETVRSLSVRTMARCYIFVMSKPVMASIRGGPNREISSGKPCQLDGSKSRDYARPPSGQQNMIYRWDCSSKTDPQNAYCHHNLGNNAVLRLDVGMLHLSMTYSFTLTVTSKVNIFSSHNTSQLLTIVSEDRLYVSITCVRNCEQDKYHAGQEIHLMGECLNCEPTCILTYKWVIEDFQVGDSKRLLYTVSSIEIVKIAVNLEMNCDGRATGRASLILSKNQPPAGGSCSVIPPSGVEYHTEFLIECQQFQYSQPPLTYRIQSAQGLWLSHSSDATTKCRLPFTESLSVLVCDSLRSCSVPQIVPVSITPLMPITNAKELKSLVTDLRHLWNTGDSTSAMVLANALLGKETSVAVTELVLAQAEHIELLTMLAVRQYVTITGNLIEPMRPIDHEKAALFKKFFAKLARGFENVLNDGEIEELDKTSYTDISTYLANILMEFSEPMEHIPEVQNHIQKCQIGKRNDLITEHYPDMKDFDDTVLMRINNWLDAVTQLYRCIQLIGKASTFQHEPSESPLEISTSALKWIAYSVEETKDRELQTLENVVNISMSSDTLKNVMARLECSHVLLQIQLFAKDNMNPYWWYPDDEQLSTGVFGFSAFSRKTKENTTIDLTDPIEFEVILQNTPELIEATEGYFENAHEMLTYSTTINAGAMLIVYFHHTAIDLKVILQIGEQPRGYQFRESKRAVKVLNTKSVYYLYNPKVFAEKAFLALRPFHLLNSDVSLHYPAIFNFTQEIRECLSWNAMMLPDPQWSSAGCGVTNGNPLGQSLHCGCYHLSTFAGKVYYLSPASVEWDRSVLERVPFNWYMCLFYISLLLIGTALIARGLRDLRISKDILIADLNNEDIRKERTLLIIFITGSQWNAGTTANIWLTFKLRHGQRTFVIQQNPEKPQLVPNSKCCLHLPLKLVDLVHPLDIVIRHDNAGRYPSWFCATIAMQDTERRNDPPHIFHVHKWITTKPIYLKAATNNNTTLKKKAIAFLRSLEKIYVQWFQLQAVMGPWSIEQNRYERSCIFVIKIAICVCVTACFYGDTTLETYEQEREIYESVIANPWQILKICLVSYGIGVLVELALRIIVIVVTYMRKK